MANRHAHDTDNEARHIPKEDTSACRKQKGKNASISSRAHGHGHRHLSRDLKRKIPLNLSRLFSLMGLGRGVVWIYHGHPSSVFCSHHFHADCQIAAHVRDVFNPLQRFRPERFVEMPADRDNQQHAVVKVHLSGLNDDGATFQSHIARHVRRANMCRHEGFAAVSLSSMWDEYKRTLRH